MPVKSVENGMSDVGLPMSVKRSAGIPVKSKSMAFIAIKVTNKARLSSKTPENVSEIATARNPPNIA